MRLHRHCLPFPKWVQQAEAATWVDGNRDALNESASSPSIPLSTWLLVPFLESKADCVFPLLEHLNESPGCAGESPVPATRFPPSTPTPRDPGRTDLTRAFVSRVCRSFDLKHHSPPRGSACVAPSESVLWLPIAW